MFKTLALLLIVLVVNGKGKTSDKLKREECEKVEVCKWDKTENCVLRCMSETCYEQVYGDIALEPGEIHREQSRLFLECFRKEEKLGKFGKSNIV